MKADRVIFLILIILTNLSSCSNDSSAKRPDIQIITGNWKILSASLQNLPETSKGNYFLFFSEAHTYELVLDKSIDINICGGDFDLVSDNRISFGGPICTKVCCDSDYAMKLIQIITKMSGNPTTYLIKNDSLILTSTGKLTLYRAP